LSSTNLDACEAFYINLVGGKLVFEFRNESGDRYGIFISLGEGTFLEIFLSDKEVISSELCRFRHFCLQVQDINCAVKHFMDAGYSPQVTIGKVDQVPQFWVEDPNGIKIEFHELSNPNLPQFRYC